MPKSRRKAAASRAKVKGGMQKDFVKKKERLGRKARPDNATNTSVKSKHIYLPNIPDEQQVLDASLKRGLTYEQLLQRVTHYNASTRMSALNGLARALQEGNLAASMYAKADRANVVRIALSALQDNEGTVRRAAVLLLASVVQGVVTVRPFARILAASWLAGLTHIRPEVQEAAASGMAAVFRQGVRPAAIFTDSVHKPLLSLAEMLNAPAARNVAKRRACVLEALVALLEGEVASVGGSKKKPVQKTVFYWHSLKDDDEISNDNVRKGVTSTEMSKALTVTTKRVANIVSECLPVHEAKKDKSIVAVLLAAVKCLYMALSMHTTDLEAKKPVVRMLISWGKERNRHHEKGAIHALHNYLAASALAVGRKELATTYLGLTLGEDVVIQLVAKDAISVENLVEKTLEPMVRNEDVTERILNAWYTRWKKQLDANNMQYVAASTSIVSKVVGKRLEADDCKTPNELEWSIICSLPQVIAKACVNCETEPNEIMSVTLELLGRVSRLYGVELRPHVLEYLSSTEVVKSMDDVMLDHLVSVLYYSCAFVNKEVLQAATVIRKFALRLMALVEAHANQLDGEQAMLAYAFVVAVEKNDSGGELAETALRIRMRFESEVET